MERAAWNFASAKANRHGMGIATRFDIIHDGKARRCRCGFHTLTDTPRPCSNYNVTCHFLQCRSVQLTLNQMPLLGRTAGPAFSSTQMPKRSVVRQRISTGVAQSLCHSLKSARVLVRLDYGAGLIEEADDRGLRTREEFRVTDRLTECVRSFKPQ